MRTPQETKVVDQPPLTERNTFLSVTGEKQVTLYYIARPDRNKDLFACHERLQALTAQTIIDGEEMLVDSLTHEQFVELYFRHSLDSLISATVGEVKRSLLAQGFHFNVHICYFAQEVREALKHPPGSPEE